MAYCNLIKTGLTYQIPETRFLSEYLVAKQAYRTNREYERKSDKNSIKKVSIKPLPIHEFM